MSSMNVSTSTTMMNVDYTRNLQQQVMSQQLLGGKAIPTVLAGATNFGPWLKRIQNFISTTNMEWGEYLITGDFVESRAGRNLSDQEISYINRILDNGMYMLIVNSVSDDIKKSVQRFYDKSETATARDVLVYVVASSAYSGTC